MDYTKLKEEIKEIAEIAADVPDAFKEKCFEVLLNHLISETPKPPPPGGTGSDAGNAGQQPPGTVLPINTQLRVFMQKNGISEEEIKTILFVADEDVHFIKEPTSKNITTGQIHWALLTALKNCILNNNLSVDPEDVRSVCQEKGYYDTANFSANFKKPKYAKLFKGPMERLGTAQALSPDGQTELAKVVKKLAASQ